MIDFLSNRAGVEVVVEDPFLDDRVVDDVPDRVLQTPPPFPVAQEALDDRSEVLGKGEVARGKKGKKKRHCKHPEPSKIDYQMRSSRKKAAFVGEVRRGHLVSLAEPVRGESGRRQRDAKRDSQSPALISVYYKLGQTSNLWKIMIGSTLKVKMHNCTGVPF